MHTLNCKGKLLVCDRPLIMGILNTTPDSFFTGNRKTAVNEGLHLAEKMLSEGADLIDMGGQSTRPGSELLPAEEEWQRLRPTLESVVKHFPEAIISIDTFYSEVAAQAINAGAHIINDISGGEMDKNMIPTVGKHQHIPYICMHMRGTPQTMSQLTQYDHVALEVLDFFIQKTEECRIAGIKDVILDPGFGFAKNKAQNFELLAQLPIFTCLEKLLLIGVSRKGMIYKTLGNTAEEALNGTTVLNTIALMNGAHILRVHDVKEAAETVQLFSCYEK